jgi:hypothetical protein
MSGRVPLCVLLILATAGVAPAAPVPPPSGPEDAAAVRLIDERLEAAWKANGLTPAAVADDHTFIRRATLALAGRVATPAEIERFLAHPKETRRARLVERLLKSADHDAYWSERTADALLPASGPFSRGPERERLRAWLEDQSAKGQSYDRIVTRLLTATGKTSDNGAAVFLLAQIPLPRQAPRPPGERPEPRDCPRGGPTFGPDDPSSPHYIDELVPAAEQGDEGHFRMLRATDRISRLFVGVRLECVRCHDHPFEAGLGQRHFWELNAFLRQIDRRGTPPTGDKEAADLELTDDPQVNRDAQVSYVRRNGVWQMRKARFLPPAPEREGAALPRDTQGLERRKFLARAVVEHPNFARAAVNRCWAMVFGRGLVEPVDDFGESNPPSHPELLDGLADLYKKSGYDTPRLLRWICLSRAFQLSAAANRGNDRPDHEPLLARFPIRQLTLRQQAGAFLTATGAEEGLDAASRRLLRQRWLDERRNEIAPGNLGPRDLNEALMLLNGKSLDELIRPEKGGLVARTLARYKTDAERLDAVFLATLNRPPNDRERKQLLEHVAARPDMDRKAVEARWQDLLWAILNSNEFMMQH